MCFHPLSTAWFPDAFGPLLALWTPTRPGRILTALPLRRLRPAWDDIVLRGLSRAISIAALASIPVVSEGQESQAPQTDPSSSAECSQRILNAAQAAVVARVG